MGMMCVGYGCMYLECLVCRMFMWCVCVRYGECMCGMYIFLCVVCVWTCVMEVWIWFVARVYLW